MNKIHLYDKILSPFVTEKSTNLSEQNKIVFKVPSKANKKNLPMQKGDVYSTYSNSKKLKNFIKYVPTTSVNVGISKFVDWYKDYYKINKL